MGRRRKKSKENEMKGIGKNRKGKEMERSGRRGKERKQYKGKERQEL